MSTDEDIKSIIKSKNVSIQLKINIIKRYLFDKTQQEVEMIEPNGQLSHLATFVANKVVTDNDLLNYFYACGKKYYNEKFNDK